MTGWSACRKGKGAGRGRGEEGVLEGGGATEEKEGEEGGRRKWGKEQQEEEGGMWNYEGIRGKNWLRRGAHQA